MASGRLSNHCSLTIKGFWLPSRVKSIALFSGHYKERIARWDYKNYIFFNYYNFNFGNPMASGFSDSFGFILYLTSVFHSRVFCKWIDVFILNYTCFQHLNYPQMFTTLSIKRLPWTKNWSLHWPKTSWWWRVFSHCNHFI